jgi:hypothetical protein
LTGLEICSWLSTITDVSMPEVWRADQMAIEDSDVYS